MRGHFMSLFAFVHLHYFFWVYGQVLVRIDYHAKQAWVGLEKKHPSKQKQIKNAAYLHILTVPYLEKQRNCTVLFLSTTSIDVMWDGSH